MVKKMKRLFDKYLLKRLINSTQINNRIDNFQDRKNELKEYFEMSNSQVDEIFKGSKRHDLFEDISTDVKLIKAYRDRTQIATISHMLSYTRFDYAFCLIRYFNRIYRSKEKRNNINVLDYGCSVADIGLAFAVCNYSVTLCDLKDGNLQFGEWRFQRRNFKKSSIPVTIDNLYPKIHGFDIVATSEVLEHLRNPLVVVKNMYDGLNKNGFLWVSGYPVIRPEVNDKHPDHLLEAADIREDVLTFILKKFTQMPIGKGFLFKKG